MRAHGVDGARIAYLCLQATVPGQASYAHVHEIVAGLRAQGARVDLFEPLYPEDRSPGALGRLWAFARIQRKLIAALADYDVLYVRGHALAWPTSRAAASRGIPVVQECNGMVDDFFIAWPSARPFASLITALTYAQFRRADAVIAGSTGLAEWLSREVGVAAHIIPNGANTDVFQPMERPEGIALPQRYVVFFGSLAPWQGITTSLAAVRDSRWPDGVSLVVVGDGVRRGEVQEAALGDDRIVYLGKLPYDQVGAVVSNSIASLVNKEQPEFEAAGISPLKLYESMACGVPVIATERMPGLTEVVSGKGTGVTVPQADPAALALAVANLASDEDACIEMGRRGRRFAEAECSWFARAEDTAAVISSVLADHRSNWAASSSE